MQPKMIWANLASADLERTTRFYAALGFQPNGSSGVLTSFLFGENKFIIHFFLRSRFEEFSTSEASDAEKQNEIIFTLSATSPEEVDRWCEKVRQAGGTSFREPQSYELGYTFGFADPDGHKFNVLYWPGM